MTRKPSRVRLMRFLEHERRSRVHGHHSAVDALHRRPHAHGPGRLIQFLRIARGLRA